MAMAESLYDELTTKFHHLGSEVVIDDRLQMSIGQRLHSARVSGYPHVVILGKQVVEIVIEMIEIAQSKKAVYVYQYDVINKLDGSI